MNKIISLFLIGISLLACRTKDLSSNQKSFYMPAEYQSHDAVWLGWIDYPPYYKPFLDIAQALYSNVPLKVVCKTEGDLQDLKARLTRVNIDTQKIAFYLMDDNRLWMRDHGATYLIHPDGEKKVVDFGWTSYGRKDALNTYYEGNEDSVAVYYQKSIGKTGMIDSLMGATNGYESIKTEVNMEGGSIEVNGQGTLILCEAVTMQRNPDLSKEYIESEFKRVLGVQQIIWMKKGLVEDPYHFARIYDNYFGWGTFGHTDEFVRFVNDSTILLAWVDEEERDVHPFNEMNYQRMLENFEILQKAKDRNGKPFKIIKTPLPDPVYLETIITESHGDVNWMSQKDWKIPIEWLPQKGMMNLGDSIRWVAASSYLNYLVTNEVVLLPTYTQVGSSPEKEAQIKEIFSQVFPNRELKFLDVMNLNYHGGGIHCVTQQEPVSTNKE